jgi:hypothetical protein
MASNDPLGTLMSNVRCRSGKRCVCPLVFPSIDHIAARIRLIAAAEPTCCKCVLAKPIWWGHRSSTVRCPGSFLALGRHAAEHATGTYPAIWRRISSWDHKARHPLLVTVTDVPCSPGQRHAQRRPIGASAWEGRLPGASVPRRTGFSLIRSRWVTAIRISGAGHRHCRAQARML